VFLLAPLWVLWLILRGTLINQAGGGRVTAMVKAITTEQRLTSLLNNGGSFGGDIHVVGGHYADGNFYINNHQVKSHQTQNANPPGGAPGSYTPSYESSLSQTCQYIMDCIYNAGIAASH
jgi:hypothetical protein